MLKILSTKILPQNLKETLENLSSYQDYEAIKITPLKIEIPKNIENAIITSKNAFRSVKEKTHITNAFCVGEKTNELLSKNNINVVCKTDYAEELAQEIIKNYKDKNFVFLSGNLRQDTIPKTLEENGIQLEEYVVYKTQLLLKKFETPFEAVLFFSPSGVKSYYQTNSSQDEIAFCIGNTTAKEIEKYNQNIQIAEQPTYQKLVEKVINYYKK